MITFKKIENSQGLKRLNELPEFNNVKDLYYSAIFKHVEKELSQLNLDLYEIWQKVQIDVNNELIQSQELDRKLTHIYKHLQKTYDKLVKLKDKNSKYAHGSKKVEKMIETLNDNEEKLKDIEKINQEILTNVLQITQSSYMTHNLQNYPILSQLIKENSPISLNSFNNKQSNLNLKALKSPFLKNSKASTFTTTDDVMTTDHVS